MPISWLGVVSALLVTRLALLKKGDGCLRAGLVFFAELMGAISKGVVVVGGGGGGGVGVGVLRKSLVLLLLLLLLLVVVVVVLRRVVVVVYEEVFVFKCYVCRWRIVQRHGRKGSILIDLGDGIPLVSKFEDTFIPHSYNYREHSTHAKRCIQGANIHNGPSKWSSS